MFTPQDRPAQPYTHCAHLATPDPTVAGTRTVRQFQKFLVEFSIRFSFLMEDLSFLIIKGFVFCNLPSFRCEPERQVRVPESPYKADLPEPAPLSRAEP